MNFIEFAQKSWYMKDWLLTKPIKEVEKKFKENERNKKKYFILKNKQKNWQTVLKEDIFLQFNDIVW